MQYLKTVAKVSSAGVCIALLNADCVTEYFPLTDRGVRCAPAGPVRVQRRVGRQREADGVLRVQLLLGPRGRRGHHRREERHHLEPQARRLQQRRLQGLLIHRRSARHLLPLRALGAPSPGPFSLCRLDSDAIQARAQLHTLDMPFKYGENGYRGSCYL